MRRTLRLLPALALLAAALPGPVRAQCAMCGTALKGGGDPLTESLSATALMMIAVPAILLISVTVWLLMQFRRVEGFDLHRVLWGAAGGTLAAALLIGALSLASGLARGSAATAPMPDDFGAVPDFHLTDNAGRTLARDDLSGSFWVVDFIFTRCQGMCPLLSRTMATLNETLAPDVQLVSISVDPGYDTPEVLTRYAAEVAGDGDPHRWRFLTGPPDDLQRLIGDGFHLAVSEGSPGDGGLLAHSDRFVLVDPEGHIRGYYHGLEDETADRIASDLERLSTSIFSRR